MEIKTLIGVLCMLLGLYVLIRAIYHFRHERIIVNGEEMTGSKAKRYAILFMIIGSMAILIPLLAILFGK